MMAFSPHSQPGMCRGRKLIRSPWIMAGFSYIWLGNVLQWNKFMFAIFSSSPNIKAVNSHNTLKMEWPSVTLRLKFKSFLLLIHSHSHGNSHQERFYCHYFKHLPWSQRSGAVSMGHRKEMSISLKEWTQITVNWQVESQILPRNLSI